MCSVHLAGFFAVDPGILAKVYILTGISGKFLEMPEAAFNFHNEPAVYTGIVAKV